jgi:hypothetical protein
MSWMASGLAFCTIWDRGVDVTLGNLKFIAAAKAIPCGQEVELGAPKTWQILYSSSGSLAPGKRGRKV